MSSIIQLLFRLLRAMSELEVSLSLQTVSFGKTTYINQTFKIQNVDYGHLLNLFYMICKTYQKLSNKEFENFTNFEGLFVTCNYINTDFVVQLNTNFQEVTFFNQSDVPIYEISGLKVISLKCIKALPVIETR